jgi:uncharacterized protein (DUF488 family)
MRIFTIGFTKKTAEEFFTKLSSAHINRLIDVRLNNISQLAGFSKRDDLRYFLRVICGVDYVHQPELAPTQALLDEYKKVSHDWAGYAQRFCALIAERHVEDTMDREIFDDACLLCSEDKADHCHRRLVAEYLRDAWGNVNIVHL